MLLAAAVLAVATLARAAAPGSADSRDPEVKPKSEVVRSLYQQPVPSDWYGLLKARETFSIAQDLAAEMAVVRYLESAALHALSGKPIAPSGTIAQLVASKPVDDLGPYPILRIFERTLHAWPSERAGVDLAARREGFAKNKEEAPGFWASYDAKGALRAVRAFTLIENAGASPIIDFRGRVMIALPSQIALLPCDPVPSSQDRALAPGQKRLHACDADPERVVLADLLQAVRAGRAGNGPLELRLDYIDFQDPPIKLIHDGIEWRDRVRAHEEVATALRAVPCEQRDACVSAGDKGIFDAHPEYVLIAWGLVAGAFTATMIFIFSTSRAKSASNVVGTIVGVLVVVVLLLGLLLPGMAALIALAVAWAGIYGLGGFVVGLFAALAVFKGRGPQSPDSA